MREFKKENTNSKDRCFLLLFLFWNNEIRKQVYQTDWLPIHRADTQQRARLQTMKSYISSVKPWQKYFDWIREWRRLQCHWKSAGSLDINKTKSFDQKPKHFDGFDCIYLSVVHQCRVGSLWPDSLELTGRLSHKPRLKSWRSRACSRGSRIYREKNEKEKRRFQSCSRWLGCCIWFTRKGEGIGWGRRWGHSKVYLWSSWRRKQKPQIRRGVRSDRPLRLMKWLA